jgi:hypothetical protein
MKKETARRIAYRDNTKPVINLAHLRFILFVDSALTNTVRAEDVRETPPTIDTKLR